MIPDFKSLWTLGLVFACHVLVINAADSVPVLLWGGNGETSPPEPVNPLHKTSRVDFEKILNRKLGKFLPPLLVFVRDSFCNEDLTQNAENLKKVKNSGMIYLPAVESPMSVFENLPSYNLTMDDDLETVADNQLAIVQATDLDRIPEIYSSMRESSPNLIAALTGRSCIYSRSERVRRATSENGTFLFLNKSDGETLFYASQYPFIKIADKDFVQLTTLSEASDAKRDGKTNILTLIFMTPDVSKLTFKFNFTLIQGYYRLISLTYSTTSDSNHTGEILLTSKDRISVPKNFSYHCSQQTIFRNGSINLKFTDLQIQLDAKGKFGDTYDCLGFTTIPIWTGIFVTAILALIMIWGLTMIMDIRTMDRFDDPKGKTITISAQE